MPFEYHQPCLQLIPYIRSYWILKGGEASPEVLYPDGCVDIVANLGKRFTAAQQNTILEEGGVYLGGALTEAMEERIPPDVVLAGVRFEPGCFENFYPPYPLGELMNGCVRISENMLPQLDLLRQNPAQALDQFYLPKLKAFDTAVKD